MTPDAAGAFDQLREPWLHDPRCREAHGPERTSLPCAWHAHPGERYLDQEPPETLTVRNGSGNVVTTYVVPPAPYAQRIELGTSPDLGHVVHHDEVHGLLAIPRGESECVGCRNPQCPDHWREPHDWPRLFHPLARRLPTRLFRRWVLWRGARLARPKQDTLSSGPRCWSISGQPT